MFLKSIFEKQMFWLILGGKITSIMIGPETSIGINKTVNWSFDITNSILLHLAFISFYSWIFFLIGYNILYFLKIKTNFYFSIIHIVFLLFSIVLVQFQDKVPLLVLLFKLISVVVFWLNIYLSIKPLTKNYQRTTNS